MIMMMFGLPAVAIGPPVSRDERRTFGDSATIEDGSLPPVHAPITLVRQQRPEKPAGPTGPSTVRLQRHSDLRYDGGKRVESRNTVAAPTNPVTDRCNYSENRRFRKSRSSQQQTVYPPTKVAPASGATDASPDKLLSVGHSGKRQSTVAGAPESTSVPRKERSSRVRRRATSHPVPSPPVPMKPCVRNVYAFSDSLDGSSA